MEGNGAGYPHVLLIALTLAGCGSVATAPVNVSQQDVATVASKTELLAMGARQLTEDEFRREIVGKTLDEGSWTWAIAADGTASSRADDGSWSNVSNWKFDGRTYCRWSTGDPRACREVYELGGIYRFGGDDDELACWALPLQ